MQLSDKELNDLISDIDQNWADDQREKFLQRLSESYEPFRLQKKASKSEAKAAKETKASKAKKAKTESDNAE